MAQEMVLDHLISLQFIDLQFQVAGKESGADQRLVQLAAQHPEAYVKELKLTTMLQQAKDRLARSGPTQIEQMIGLVTKVPAAHSTAPPSLAPNCVQGGEFEQKPMTSAPRKKGPLSNLLGKNKKKVASQ